MEWPRFARRWGTTVRPLYGSFMEGVELTNLSEFPEISAGAYALEMGVYNNESLGLLREKLLGRFITRMELDAS